MLACLCRMPSKELLHECGIQSADTCPVYNETNEIVDHSLLLCPFAIEV